MAANGNTDRTDDRTLCHGRDGAWIGNVRSVKIQIVFSENGNRRLPYFDIARHPRHQIARGDILRIPAYTKKYTIDLRLVARIHISLPISPKPHH